MIKCACGNKGCSTILTTYISGTYTIELVMSHRVGDKEQEERLVLDANSLVQLIRELKEQLGSLG